MAAPETQTTQENIQDWLELDKSVPGFLLLTEEQTAAMIDISGRATVACRAKSVLTCADRGCCVVSTTISNGRILDFIDRSLYFSSKQLLNCAHEAEWTPFQIQYFSENLVVPGIEPGTSGSVARNSDHRGGCMIDIYV
jgi:hypothetical protein